MEESSLKLFLSSVKKWPMIITRSSALLPTSTTVSLPFSGLPWKVSAISIIITVLFILKIDILHVVQQTIGDRMVTFNYKVHGSCNIGELFVIVLAQTGDMVLREPFRSALQQRLTALQQHISNTDMMCNTEKLCA